MMSSRTFALAQTPLTNLLSVSDAQIEKLKAENDKLKESILEADSTGLSSMNMETAPGKDVSRPNIDSMASSH